MTPILDTIFFGLYIRSIVFLETFRPIFICFPIPFHEKTAPIFQGGFRVFCFLFKENSLNLSSRSPKEDFAGNLNKPV